MNHTLVPLKTHKRHHLIVSSLEFSLHIWNQLPLLHLSSQFALNLKRILKAGRFPCVSSMIQMLYISKSPSRASFQTCIEWSPVFIRCRLWFLRSDEHHLQHARWLQEEMPVRLAHRLSDFLQLPFVIVCNARFHEVHGSVTLGERRKLLTNHWFLWSLCFKGRTSKSCHELSCICTFQFWAQFWLAVFF